MTDECKNQEFEDAVQNHADMMACIEAEENLLDGTMLPEGKIKIAQISGDWEHARFGKQIIDALKAVDGGFAIDYPQDAVDGVVVFVSNVDLTSDQLDQLWDAGGLVIGDKDFWEGEDVADIAAQLRRYLNTLE